MQKVDFKREFFAYLDEMQRVTILLPLTYHNGNSSAFSLQYGSYGLELEVKEVSQIDQYRKYICSVPEEVSLGVTSWIIDEHGGRTDLQTGAVIRTARFEEKFYYDGIDLGVSIKHGETQFKLWAPTAVQVKIKLLSPDSPYFEIVKLQREDRGIWSASIPRDLEGFRYSYLLLIDQEWNEAVDPYAVSATPNGEFGVIVNLEKTRISHSPLPAFNNPVDAVIYETHIRDFTIHPSSGTMEKGKYLGAAEAGTSDFQGRPTGMSYLKDLGVTHVEFLPFNDFAGVDELDPDLQYNWGYNPLHFNVPEGSFSSNPVDPYSRIKELKEMIRRFHENGLRVIMDAVYNHVYIRESSPFEKIVPGYYFRHDEYGMPSNGTGVGNDIASERLMARKFILDSVRFWMEEYRIDGIRFDLMGILDVTTMNEIKKIAESINPDVILFGEGWDLNTPLEAGQKAIIRNQSKMMGIGQFNDLFRDTIKGCTFNLYDKGYALGNEHYFDAAKEVLTGSIGFKKKEKGLFSEPSQSVNYVEAHDNNTLWDKLLACFPDTDTNDLRFYHRLATSLVFLSQGIPFLHSGQEFFRTKKGVGNSYRSPDAINQLDWDRRADFNENVEYIKGIISLRKFFGCFRMRTADEIRRRITQLELPSPLIGFHYNLVNDDNGWSEVLLLVNPTRSAAKIKLPPGEWTIFADRVRAGLNPLSASANEDTELDAVSIKILAKK